MTSELEKLIEERKNTAERRHLSRFAWGLLDMREKCSADDSGRCTISTGIQTGSVLRGDYGDLSIYGARSRGYGNKQLRDYTPRGVNIPGGATSMLQIRYGEDLVFEEIDHELKSYMPGEVFARMLSKGKQINWERLMKSIPARRRRAAEKYQAKEAAETSKLVAASETEERGRWAL
jgi:hypothetical protein